MQMTNNYETIPRDSALRYPTFEFWEEDMID